MIHFKYPISSSNPLVITANELLSGKVVYQNHNGTWCFMLNQPQKYFSLDAAQLALHHITQHDPHKVGVKIIQIQILQKTDGSTYLSPTETKEIIRLQGPHAYVYPPSLSIKPYF